MQRRDRLRGISGVIRLAGAQAVHDGLEARAAGRELAPPGLEPFLPGLVLPTLGKLVLHLPESAPGLDQGRFPSLEVGGNLEGRRRLGGFGGAQGRPGEKGQGQEGLGGRLG